MIEYDRQLLKACGLCHEPVEGVQLRKCVGLGVSMLFYGLTVDQINPALRSMGEAPVADELELDLRVWCARCAAGVMAAPPARPRANVDCALCRAPLRAHPEDRGLLAEPGCVMGARTLCQPCRVHVFFRESGH